MANQNDVNGAALGKYGVAYVDTTDLFEPPSGMIITAIQFLAQNTLNTLTSVDTDAGIRRYANTANAAHSSATNLEGTNGQQIDNTLVFVRGTIIYGRWNSVKLQTADSDGGIFIYLAPKGS
mgnify:FL=1|tara:strand:- start:133 stop:498 length:366 start_codon:yes stop_codon:yes gene_type:complete